jgi:glycosyltransferase involved in cell wall biosynthesis
VSEYAVVVPTLGRPSLQALIDSLADATGPAPQEVILVNDRPAAPISVRVPDRLRPSCRVIAGPGRGPAAARNVGWRSARAPWVVFVDDDVRPDPEWTAALQEDIARATAASAAAVQGALSVPLPTDRRPTDWERQVAGLATAQWITADIAYRRDVLDQVGGFDERFPRAFREDSDLALRVRRRGHLLLRGTRRATHPVRPAGPWVSLARQVGNADDALLRRLYGPRWRELAQAPPGRRRRHALITAAGLIALLAAATGRRPLAGLAGLAWLTGTAEFALHRMLAGPRTAGEVFAMAATSALIPPLAVTHWLRGWVTYRHARPHGEGER